MEKLFPLIIKVEVYEMKLNLKKLILKFGGTVATLAVAVATVSANSTCMWISHQPELPEDVKKLRNF